MLQDAAIGVRDNHGAPRKLTDAQVDAMVEDAKRAACAALVEGTREASITSAAAWAAAAAGRGRGRGRAGTRRTWSARPLALRRLLVFLRRRLVLVGRVVRWAVGGGAGDARGTEARRSAARAPWARAWARARPRPQQQQSRPGVVGWRQHRRQCNRWQPRQRRWRRPRRRRQRASQAAGVGFDAIEQGQYIAGKRQVKQRTVLNHEGDATLVVDMEQRRRHGHLAAAAAAAAAGLRGGRRVRPPARPDVGEQRALPVVLGRRRPRAVRLLPSIDVLRVLWRGSQRPRLDVALRPPLVRRVRAQGARGGRAPLPLRRVPARLLRGLPAARVARHQRVEPLPRPRIRLPQECVLRALLGAVRDHRTGTRRAGHLD